MSATLTGTIYLGDTASPLASTIVAFRALAYPTIHSTGVFSGLSIETTTNTSGLFTVNLAPAVYRIEWWAPGCRNRALVPMGTANANLIDLIVAEIGEIASYYFATVAEFQASTTNAALVGIQADANGDPGIWRRGGTGAHDGVNIIVRTDGVIYSRLLTGFSSM